MLGCPPPGLSSPFPPTTHRLLITFGGLVSPVLSRQGTSVPAIQVSTKPAPVSLFGDFRMVHKATEHQADWTRIPGSPDIALGRRTHRQGVLEPACSSVSSGDATHMDEIHCLTWVTARGLHFPHQASIQHRQGTQG